MPELKRNFWGGYYKTPTTGPDNMLLGTRIYHSTNCGIFTWDGVEYNCMYFFLCKDQLADTQGHTQEMFDASLIDGDRVLDLLSADLSAYATSVQSLITADMESGLDIWDILNARIGVMIPEFMGFTFDEACSRYPGILTHIEITDDDGNKSMVDNIKPFIAVNTK